MQMLVIGPSGIPYFLRTVFISQSNRHLLPCHCIVHPTSKHALVISCSLSQSSSTSDSLWKRLSMIAKAMSGRRLRMQRHEFGHGLRFGFQLSSLRFGGNDFTCNHGQTGHDLEDKDRRHLDFELYEHFESGVRVGHDGHAEDTRIVH